MDEEFTTEEVFDSAVSIVRNLPKEGPIKPSDELKLKLYAYYKQATHGPNDTPKPRFYRIVEAYKWDAWDKLGDMSKEDAMLSYIDELKQIMQSIPHEETDEQDSKHFEDVLGKKFYDYWFKQWEQSGMKKHGSSSSTELIYPNDLDTTDQFASAILRLQHELEGTNSRLDTIESQLKEAMSSICALRAQSDLERRFRGRR